MPSPIDILTPEPVLPDAVVSAIFTSSELERAPPIIVMAPSSPFPWGSFWLKEEFSMSTLTAPLTVSSSTNSPAPPLPPKMLESVTSTSSLPEWSEAVTWAPRPMLSRNLFRVRSTVTSPVQSPIWTTRPLSSRPEEVPSPFASMSLSTTSMVQSRVTESRSKNTPARALLRISLSMMISKTIGPPAVEVLTSK